MDSFFFKWLFQEHNFGHIIYSERYSDTVKEWRSSRSKYVKSFEFVLDFKILLPLNKRAVLLHVGVSFEFYFESNTNGKAWTRFKRDDVTYGHAPSAVPSKVLSLANLPGQKRFFLVFT